MIAVGDIPTRSFLAGWHGINTCMENMCGDGPSNFGGIYASDMMDEMESNILCKY